MNRFGRSDGRWGDRWGGGFVLAVILALAGAWYAGDKLADRYGPAPANTEYGDPMAYEQESSMGGELNQLPPMTMAEYPKPLTVYFLQAHALRSQEKAAAAAADLAVMGVPAAVARDGEWYKVIVGAYGSKDAADAAKASAETATNLSLYANRVSIAGQPAVQPVLAEAQGPYTQAVSALNNFMHAAADWWDRYATASYPEAADQVTIQAQELQALSQSLQSHAADPAVNDLLRIAQMAVQSGQDISQLAANPQPNGAAYQAAMENYVALVDAYRAWAGASQ